MSRLESSLQIAGLLFGSLKTTGGYQVFAYNLFRHLAKRGHPITLYITANEYGNDPKFYDNLPFRVQALLGKTKWLAKYAPALVKRDLCRKQKIEQHDIWQIIGAYPAGFLATALKGLAPLVLRTHGDDVQADTALGYGQRLDTLRNREVIATLKQMDRLIALTPSVSACYREMGISDDHIIEIPNGIDIKRFSQQTDREAQRRMRQLPADVPLLLTVSRNHPKKGLDMIPHIAAILKQEGRSFHWLIAGEDAELLQPKIVDSGVSDCVTTIGEIGVDSQANAGAMVEMPPDALIDIYKSADVFVFPSRLETFGRVLIEAMAAGLPVVTTSAPGCRDVVAHEITGLQSAPDKPEAMADHIQNLLDNQALKQRLIENGRQHALKYDWDIIVDTYENLYNSLLTP